MRGDELRLAVFTDTYPPQVNGVARTVARLVDAMESRGAKVCVATVHDPGAPMEARVRRWPSRAFWAYPELRVSAPSVARARALIRAWRPTLIHVVTEFGVGLAGLVGAKREAIPVVTSYHTNFKDYLKFYGLGALSGVAWPYLRWVHNQGARTFVPSRVVARQLEERGFRNVRLWTRGVDTGQFNPAHRSREVRTRWDAAGDPVVLYVGRLAREKGIATLCAAMHRVRERCPRARLVVVGDGPTRAECVAAAPPGSVFTGMLTGRDLLEAYASADVFAFPSTTETFGNVVLEAMASGLPVIAPDIGATTDIANVETARLFRAGNVDTLAEAIVGVLSDASERTRLRAASLSVASRRSWDAVWDRLLLDYAEVMGRSAVA